MADDQFANGLLHYLCAAVPIDENSAFDFPMEDDLNDAISRIAKAVDGFHAEILPDLAVCRITLARDLIARLTYAFPVTPFVLFFRAVASLPG
jgi:hypothetical protein